MKLDGGADGFENVVEAESYGLKRVKGESV